MVWDQGFGRSLVESLLQQAGYRPEALPNLYHIDTLHGVVPDRASTLGGVVKDLARWRQIFPETIDSIVRLGQTSTPQSELGWMADSPNFYARHVMRPAVSSMFGNPLDVAMIEAVGNPEEYQRTRPSLYEQVLAEEPASPEFSRHRFSARIPADVLRGAEQYPEGIPLNALMEDLHPMVRRRLIRGQLARHWPNWGDILASDALTARLRGEDPEAFDELLRATTSGQLAGARRQARGASGTGFPLDPLAELNRRIASIYGQAGLRHSGAHTNPDILVEPRSEADFRRSDLTRGGYYRRVREEMKKNAFNPPSFKADATMDELLMDDALAEAQLRRGHGTASAQYSRSARAAGGNQFIRQHFGDELTTSPTNVKIQQILNKAIGRGPGKMRGSIEPNLLYRLTASGALPIAGEIVGPAMPNKFLRDVTTGAARGAGAGAILGPYGALAGAGAGALLSQVF